MSHSRPERNGDIGLDPVRQQQDLLAKELRQELLNIEEKRREVLHRVTNYLRAGLLTEENVSFIRRNTDSMLAPPFKKKKRESDQDRVPEMSSPHYRPKPCPLSRKSGHASTVGDAASLTDDQSSSYPIIDESVFCTIRISEDEETSEDESQSEFSSSERRPKTHQRSESYGLLTESDTQLEPLRRLLNCWPIKSFPRNCPLCVNRFSHKRSLIRHLFGDRSTERVATCSGLTPSALLSLANGSDPSIAAAYSEATANGLSSHQDDDPNEVKCEASGDLQSNSGHDDFGPDEDY